MTVHLDIAQQIFTWQIHLYIK